MQTFAGYHIRPNFAHTISPVIMHSLSDSATLSSSELDDMSVWPGSGSLGSSRVSLLSLSSPASSMYSFCAGETTLLVV